MGERKTEGAVESFRGIDTVCFRESPDRIEIIDQMRLPGRVEVLALQTEEEIYRAIKALQVRGAPAIGVTAGYALYLLMKRCEACDEGSFRGELERVRIHLDAARPTAVNLSWALARVERAALEELAGEGAPDFPALRDRVLGRMRREADGIWEEDIRCCRQIGEQGLALVRDGDGILTHCNAGRLATVRYGTATAPIYVGQERGMRLHVYCDETRPLLQGARLTAFELSAAGIETTLLCDNMASSVMAAGRVQAVFVGCDRVAANGDTANKIGTSGVAILAKHYGIPFYVCAPLSTIDRATPDGSRIVIEERDPREVTEAWYRERMAPDNAHFHVCNPAFDVTDHELITAIVTPVGVLRPPFAASIAAALGDNRSP